MNKLDNPVASLTKLNARETDKKQPELDFTPDGNALFIKSYRDWRKTKKWEQVTDMQWMVHGEYWIVKTDRFGWNKLAGCKIKQG